MCARRFTRVMRYEGKATRLVFAMGALNDRIRDAKKRFWQDFGKSIQLGGTGAGSISDRSGTRTNAYGGRYSVTGPVHIDAHAGSSRKANERTGGG